MSIIMAPLEVHHGAGYCVQTLERLTSPAVAEAQPQCRADMHACDLETFNTKNCIACKLTSRSGRNMPPVLTAEDVVRRIATECAFVDDRGGVGIRLEPAAAIVRQYGEQFRRAPRRRQSRRPKPPSLL
jgi:hypothetical protein